MKDADKTREQLITELVELRRRAAELGVLETERRRAELEYRTIIRTTMDGFWLTDMQGRLLDVNDAYCQLIGYGRDELLKMRIPDIEAIEKPEETAAHIAKIRKVGKDRFETYHRCKDGRIVDIEVSVNYIEVDEGRMFVFIRNITERKEAEERERQLQQELHLSNRLAAIGELAAGVAHEINNPLTGIMGYSELLLRKPTDENTRKGLEIIHSSSLRVAKIVQNLLTFARHRQPKKEYVDINEIVKEALELRAYELKTSNIEVALDLAPDLPQIMSDFHQIQEVSLNLILNAEQAISESHRGGKLIIKTKQLKGRVRVSFTDDGPGIPAEHLNKLFDPFFTTRGEKGGTGLGLSLCHGIVEEHKGRIYAKSKMGEGATLFVELPLTTKLMPPAEEYASSSPPHQRSHRVCHHWLLPDDRG